MGQVMTFIRQAVGVLAALAIACLAAATSSGGPVASAGQQVGRQVIPLGAGWRFHKGDLDGAEAPGLDDSDWQTVRVPHDWAIAGPFHPKAGGGSGKLPWKGVGWYRKTLSFDEADRGRRVYLDFDGVMAFPKVYVNGQLAGQWDYGYTSFRVDATPYVKFGQPNTVAVRVDTRKHGTRWYPGAGIYRKVTLTLSNPVHVAHWGTFITTPKVSDDVATVDVQTTVENDSDRAADVRLDVTLLYPEAFRSASAAADSVKVTIPAGGKKVAELSLKVGEPERWDVDDPKLYTALVYIRTGDKVWQTGDALLDSEVIPFGIRTYELTADDGFHLNGRRVQLHGVCLHHDQGPLGAAFYGRAMQRQLQIMRDMGVNAVRTSHNPPAPELLDLCDRMGIVVWDECFDKWDQTADRIDGQPPLREYGEKQIRSLVMRDRNHPSVIVWSVGNEIAGGKEGVTPERVKLMSDFARKYDPTRPVGMACHIPQQAHGPMFTALDFTGWNYMRRYGEFREHYPDKPILYSESASTVSTRGFYELPLPAAKTDFSKTMWVNSYDMNSARWSDIPDKEFDLMERDRFVAGEFVWTGFDYLGEPTPFDRQARSSYFGIVDLCGIPKDRYWLYRSYWRPETTTVHILPHWNWPDRVGQNVPVFVYTNGDSAELFLNGKSLGRRTKLRQIPPRVNIAEGKPATASSQQDQNPAAMGNDGNGDTRWRAADREPGQWWEVDLGQVQPIADVEISLDGGVRDRQYEIQVSRNGTDWQTVAAVDEWKDEWGDRVFQGVGADARYLRIVFTKLRGRATPSISEFCAYRQSYYAMMDKYRLRWMDVTYEPGELKAVAYKDGRRIGEALVRTAGPPSAVRLTPDRTDLTATGEDLCYVLVEAVDQDGTPCPLAGNLVRFRVEGPAEIAGVGNGNELSLEPFQADHRKLFFGKAMLILRTAQGPGGEVPPKSARASAATLQVATVCDTFSTGSVKNP
jgi:beta-galactosidase